MVFAAGDDEDGDSEAVDDGYALPWMVAANGVGRRTGPREGGGAERGFKCLGCNKVFSEERSLVNHLKDSIKCDPTSTTIAPPEAAFACKLCERNFVDEAALKKHQAQKHTGRRTAPESLKPDWFKGKRDTADDDKEEEEEEEEEEKEKEKEEEEK